MQTTLDNQGQPPAAGGSTLQQNNLLGSKLSIITNAQVRYEGILSKADPITKALILINVRSFGTEGRRGENNEI